LVNFLKQKSDIESTFTLNVAQVWKSILCQLPNLNSADMKILEKIVSMAQQKAGKSCD